MSALPKTTPPPEPDWHRYEQLKQSWAAEHPAATQTEYDAAMREIARECGV